MDKVEKEQQARPCPQDCGKCSPWQQMFCCTKMVFELSKHFQEARAEVAQLREELSELKQTIPMQVTELSSPTLSDIAQ